MDPQCLFVLRNGIFRLPCLRQGIAQVNVRGPSQGVVKEIIPEQGFLVVEYQATLPAQDPQHHHHYSRGRTNNPLPSSSKTPTACHSTGRCQRSNPWNRIVLPMVRHHRILKK
jgi:hypothetical protein